MSQITKIQWADSTVNPIMGCGGCELFPPPRKVLAEIDLAVEQAGVTIKSSPIFKKLISGAHARITSPLPGHKNAVNTTNIWHFREPFVAQLKERFGDGAAQAAEAAISRSITCYAGKLHLNKGVKLHSPDYAGKEGYAPIFESVTQFAGRAKDASHYKDLLGTFHPETPWKGRLPRLIFVSDMGDALSTKADFPFLKSDLMPAIMSEKGRNHLWLWLTKRPEWMAEFAEKIGGFPENVCAMTTLTGPDQESLKRLADLKRVKAHIRGLSIEPLWERIPPSKLNLKGIDWLILGGESGAGLKFTRPFALEWAEEMRDHCHRHGVAFFLKQLGRNPSRNGEVFRLKDTHGGDWDEWPDEALRVREFPKAFHDYRKEEMVVSGTPRPVQEKKPKMNNQLTKEEKAEFRHLHKVVMKGIKAFAAAGEALAKIHAGKLWRAGGHKTWDEYCQSVAGMTRAHASRLMRASACMAELKTSPIGDVLPVAESQVRPLLKLTNPEDRVEVWTKAVEKADGKQPTAADVLEVVMEVLEPEGGEEKPPTLGECRTDVVGRLRSVVSQRKSWKEVEELLSELEELM